MQADLATAEGVLALQESIGTWPVSALLANAGHGLGEAFLDQDFKAIRHVIDTNITGTLDLIHSVARDMRERREGRILITGSIAGLMPGSFQATYNGSKAFFDAFAQPLRNELRDSGVTVTCLLPSVTDTEFFARAGLQDTRIGRGPKADPADVAEQGFEATPEGGAAVVPGWKDKLQAWLSHETPDTVLAEQHRKTAEPDSADR